MHCVCTRTGFGVAALALGCLAQAGPVHAQQEDIGFSVPSSVVQGSGARALGMGGAFLARPDDATAASWNPAGLSYLARPEVSLVGVFKRFDQTTGTPAGQTLYTEDFHGTSPDFLSGAWPVRIGSVSGSVQLGYQRVLGFLGTRKWSRIPSTSDPGPDTETIDFESDSTGGFDTLSAGFGLHVARPLRVGLVVNRWQNGFEEHRERLDYRRTVQEVTFDLAGWNINLGAIVHPVESINIGFVYKSPFKASIDLSRRRTDPDLPAISVAGAASLDFPGAVGVGVSWRVQSPLTLSADFTRSYWSDGLIHDYIDVGRPPVTEPELYYPTLVRSPSQVDSDQWRLGMEYVVVGSRLSVPLRAGYYSDRQYFVDAFEAAPRYNGFTAGVGLVVRGLLLDVAYVFQRGAYPEAEWAAYSGKSEVTTHQVYGSFIYRFGSN